MENTPGHTPGEGAENAAPSPAPTAAAVAGSPPASGGAERVAASLPGTGDGASSTAGSERRGRGRPRGSKTRRPTISPRKLQEERADDARRGNLEKAREQLADTRAAQPEKPPLSEETLKAGARMFVRFLWLISGLGARLFGGKLAALDDADADDGAKEALPVIKRFRFLASILSVLGFPLWMAATISKRFEKKPAAAPPAQLHALPSTSKAAP